MSVYKITDGELVYYGSTIQPLFIRLRTHRSTGNHCETKHFNKDNMTIELVEEVEDKEQRLWRERYYIENNECVNKFRPVVTKEELKEQKSIGNKKRWAEKKEYIKEYRATPFHCECGSVVRWNDKARHFRSKKHINNINE